MEGRGRDRETEWLSRDITTMWNPTYPVSPSSPQFAQWWGSQSVLLEVSLWCSSSPWIHGVYILAVPTRYCICNGCFLSHHLSWWQFCLDGLPRSASPGLASSYGCCLRFSHSLCSGILSNMLILNLSPLCMPEINTFLFAICGYLKFLLW